jgi:hypothetical protein
MVYNLQFKNIVLKEQEFWTTLKDIFKARGDELLEEGFTKLF